MTALRELLNNPAFLLLIGTIVTAFFGYRAAWIPYRNKSKPVDVAKANSLQEVKEVVAILSETIDRQEKRYEHELKKCYTRIDALEINEAKLYAKIDALQSRLRVALNDETK